jgi:hypothetical protein
MDLSIHACHSSDEFSTDDGLVLNRIALEPFTLCQAGKGEARQFLGTDHSPDAVVRVG